MLVGVGVGVGYLRGGVGAGVSGVAPVISDLAYDGGTNEISLNTDTASGTVYYELAATSTPMTGAAIEAATMGTVAVSSGVVTEIEDWTGEPDGTYWLNVVHKAGGLYSNVLNLEVTISTVFNPATIADFVWDAADTSRLWQNTAGSTAVTTTGDPVARIDNPGLAGGFFQNTGATDRPAYTTSGALRYLDFDGSNDYLQWTGTAGDINFSSGMYLIIGIQEMTAQTNCGWVGGVGATNTMYDTANSFFLSGGDNGTQAAWLIAGLFTAAGVNFDDTGGSPMPKAIVEIEVTPATGSANAYIRVRRVGDGDVVLKNTDTVTAGGFPNTATGLDRLFLGCFFDAGAKRDYGDIQMYCGAMVNGAVTTQNKTDMRAWVAGKIGF